MIHLDGLDYLGYTMKYDKRWGWTTLVKECPNCGAFPKINPKEKGTCVCPKCNRVYWMSCYPEHITGEC